jgi:threonine/homoserine/homoserine lactone efflux protein
MTYVASMGLGLLAGILFSIPPGPATAAVMSRIFESKRRAYKGVLQMLLADLILLTVVISSFEHFRPALNSLWFKVLAGLFLIGFSVVFLLRSRHQINPIRSNPFRLVVTNPSAWLGTLTVVALANFGTEISLLFVVFYEMGVLIWFAALIEVSSKFSPRLHQQLLNGSIVLIGLAGIALVIRTLTVI